MVRMYGATVPVGLFTYQTNPYKLIHFYVQCRIYHFAAFAVLLLT